MIDVEVYISDLFCPMVAEQIWLVGGTSESADLARVLQDYQLPCVVTVVSPSAQGLYPQSALLHVHTGALTKDTIGAFVKHFRITAILDASHPYATDISQLAMRTALQFNCPYLRFERSHACQYQPQSTDKLIELSHLLQLLTDHFLVNQRVLLTIGSQALSSFKPWQMRSTLFARVLPQLRAIQAAEQAGFGCDRIIALRPPISFELEKALWQQWQISVVVTKASGQPGGEDVKRQVAAALGVTLITIKRPQLTYPQQTSDVAVAVKFCQDALHHNLT